MLRHVLVSYWGLAFSCLKSSLASSPESNKNYNLFFFFEMFSIITEYTNTKIQYLYPLLLKKKNEILYTNVSPFLSFW